jgi:hypothetical protein
MTGLSLKIFILSLPGWDTEVGWEPLKRKVFSRVKRQTIRDTQSKSLESNT